MDRLFSCRLCPLLWMGLLLVYPIVAVAHPPVWSSTETEDLKKKWKILGPDDALQPYPDGKGRFIPVVYLLLDEVQGANSTLKISSAKPFSLFLNDRLFVLRKRQASLDLDSLKATLSPPWRLGIYQPGGTVGLHTERRFPLRDQTPFNTLRTPPYFMNFAIMASLILIAFLSLLLSDAPHLAESYLIFFRLSPIRERWQEQLSATELLRSNVLQYLFNSMLAALVLLSLFHFAGNTIAAAEYFPFRTTPQAFYQWARLSGLIVALLLTKLLITGSLSVLFAIRDNARIQFYNYVRLVFFTFGIAGAFCLSFFWLGIDRPSAYRAVFYGIVFTLLIWVIFTSAKLFNRSSYPFFYLFFYLCGAEIIPTVIAVGMLVF